MATLTDREYDAELHKLHDQLLLMGAKVEEMIANSMRALTERDSELARRMIEYDHQINRLEVEIDDLCLRILAKRQPVASDLRLITTALKLVTDLERMGDACVNICERVVELNMEPILKPYVDLPRMAETVQAMVRDGLDAFVQADPERAREVMDRDRAPRPRAHAPDRPARTHPAHRAPSPARFPPCAADRHTVSGWVPY